MIAPAVITRELRVEARHAFTYWLRVIGAGGAMLMAWLMSEDEISSSMSGLRLFNTLRVTIYWAIWIIVPFLTADCLSREKRQGTLGLLFLTPLKPGQIVLAKGLAHGLRALTLALAALPVLTIPFIMGGVSWKEALNAVLIEANALCWALSAGILASALSTKWLRAMIFAEILAFLFHFLFLNSYGWMLGYFGIFPVTLWGVAPSESCMQAAWFFIHEEPLIEFGPRIGIQVQKFLYYLVLSTAATLALTLLTTLLVLGFAALKIRRSWKEEPPSAARQWLHNTFCQPMFFLPVFNFWMRHKLRRNPIGWLEQRTWSGRIIIWSWLGIMVSFYSVSIPGSLMRDDVFQIMHNLVALALMVSMAVTSAGSFQRERETGLLELLLVSPLKVAQIISGRLRGIWNQFLLTALLFFGLWIYFVLDVHWRPYRDTPVGNPLMFYLCTYITLPVIGLYYSLARRHFLSALLWTVFVGLILPVVFVSIAGRVYMFFYYWAQGANMFRSTQLIHIFLGGLKFSLLAIPVQLAFAATLFVKLHRNLERRKFALERRDA